MSALFWVLLASLAIVSLLFVRGLIRAKLRPVSYEWGWSPISFVVNSVFPKGRSLLARGEEKGTLFLHRLFHAFFHQMKRFHDRVFGKTPTTLEGTPSFFLKTIAEHKDGVAESEHEERKNGLS
jgi:hypothetical protein